MKKYISIFLILFFISSCSNEEYKIISNIDEASGICYIQEKEVFIVVADEGDIFKLNKEGDILNHKFLGKYDLEGIYCDNENIFVLQENGGNILSIGYDKLNILKKIKINLSKKDMGKYFDEKFGAEGIAYDGEYLYISTQNIKNNLLRFKLKNNKLNLDKIYDIKLKDLSGLTILDNILYILSDKNDLILKFDLNTEKVIQDIKLKKGHWEGIVFDENGNIYLADDEGFIVKI